MNKANKALLRALETKYMAYRYPSVPRHVVPFTVYTDSTANGLTRCICDFLNYSDHQAERINTMGVARTKRATCGKIVGVTWTKSTSTPGSADISATIYGKSVKIEVKIGKDRMSEAQKRYQENIERAGGIYYVAKTFDNFVEWYDIFSQNYKNK